MAHARSGDPALIAGYIGKGDLLPLAIGEFSQLYAKQNLDDYHVLASAIKDGVIEAMPES